MVFFSASNNWFSKIIFKFKKIVSFFLKGFFLKDDVWAVSDIDMIIEKLLQENKFLIIGFNIPFYKLTKILWQY